MSFNKSRSDKSEPQYRKSGRSASFNQQRPSSGVYNKGAGGGPAPLPYPSLSSNRSLKKSNNAQGGQSRSNSPAVNSSQSSNTSAAHDNQNGAHVQPQFQGASYLPIRSVASQPVKSPAIQSGIQAVSKAPTSQHATISSDSGGPVSAGKEDASEAFSLQFGSITPGFMNGMQIPARTSSAPPNLDEQKRDQARHDSSFKSVPNLPTPFPKQQPPRKDSVGTDQSSFGVALPAPKVKRDVQSSAAPPANQTEKPSLLNVPMTSIQMPFHHQSQVSMLYGGPNPQIQSQSVTATSIQMPMHIPLPMGNGPQVQQQVFVPGLQAHPLPPQGLMHQGRGLSFTPPIGGQLTPQLGNLGMGIAPPYSQQQGGKFSVSRKTTPVKITHPDTHEELRLDKRSDTYGDGGSSGPRTHPNTPSQSQPIPSFAPSHPINYYSNSYNTNSVFYPASSSLPFASSQIPPNVQGPRINYPVSQGHQSISFMNSAAAQCSLAVNKSLNLARDRSESVNVEPVCDAPYGISRATSGSTQVTVKSATVSAGQKIADSSISSILPSVEKVGSVELSTPASEVSSSQAPRDLDTCLESSVQQPKPGNKSLSSNLLPAATKQLGEVTATNLCESSVQQAKLVATYEESMPVFPNIEDRREGLSRSNSIKDYQKKLGKKGHIQPPIQSEISGIKDEEEKHLAEEHLTQNVRLEVYSQTTPLQSVELKPDQESALKVTTTIDEVYTPDTAQRLFDEDMGLGGKVENVEVTDSRDNCTSKITDNTDVEGSRVTKPGLSDRQSDLAQNPDSLESTSNCEGEGVQLLSSKDKPAPELSRTKSSINRAKKKRKEFLQKADAAGTTSDLYMAYKGPGEKKETITLAEGAESNSVGVKLKQASHEPLEVDAIVSDKICESKVEPDDWEDAADISTPNLETSDTAEMARVGLVNHGKDGSANMMKYSRDFLLKFAAQCTDLPRGFEIASDAEAFMAVNVNAYHAVDRESHSSPGRIMDRQFSGSRSDRRASGMVDDDKWIRTTSSFGPGRDLRLDIGYGAAPGFRPGQGGNFGGLWHPSAQTSFPYVGGVLTGPMQPMGPQGWIQHSSPDADRWHRASSNQQKGLIPSPQTPLQTMHKAERKYQVGKVADEEQAKQRKLKGILNKLTPQNFERLFEQVKSVNIDNAVTLTGVISQIFDKALMEPTFCEMYANFCYHLAGELPDFSEDNEKITFKRLLLNKCQEEFERGEREQEEANKIEEEGEAKLSEEEREEKRVKARRRMLGNIRLIGELYKKKMLTERIMHECINKLLGKYENPDEEDVEALCKLMSTIGDMIDHPKAKVYMDAYFERMAKLSNNMKLSSRVRFMLKDAIDLRKNKWQQRRKVDGPKKIEEVHRDAAQERQAQSSRLARGPGINPSGRRTPMEFGPRGSMLSSPGAQMGSFRGLQAQPHGFGARDVRMDERQSVESRTLSVPLPQRPIADDSITLGPQGGLARGMSFKGSPIMSGPPLANISPTSWDSRTVGSNGFSSLSERPTYGPREDLMSRSVTDRFVPTASFDQPSSQERGLNIGNRDSRATDRSFVRPFAASPSAQGQSSGFSQNVPPEKGLSEERLRDMSMEAIKEFYSARDEKEVALCIKDLNCSSFHPTMVALWVTDCFERKDMERDLLAKLLVNLTRSRDGVLSRVELVRGFESVLSTLEDDVNDAPKAAEYLGSIFGKVIVENVISLTEIGRLIFEGGEEAGRLVEVGLGGDVIGSTLGMIKTEKGESVLNEIRGSSNLRLEDFRPPHPSRSRILETFI